MRTKVVFLNRMPDGDNGQFGITKEQLCNLLDEVYASGLEDGRNKALAEEYVKMTTLQMAVDDVEAEDGVQDITAIKR